MSQYQIEPSRNETIPKWIQKWQMTNSIDFTSKMNQQGQLICSLHPNSKLKTKTSNETKVSTITWKIFKLMIKLICKHLKQQITLSLKILIRSKNINSSYNKKTSSTKSILRQPSKKILKFFRTNIKLLIKWSTNNKWLLRKK